MEYTSYSISCRTTYGIIAAGGALVPTQEKKKKKKNLGNWESSE